MGPDRSKVADPNGLCCMSLLIALPISCKPILSIDRHKKPPESENVLTGLRSMKADRASSAECRIDFLLTL